MLKDVVWSQMLGRQFSSSLGQKTLSALVISQHAWPLPLLFESAWTPCSELRQLLDAFDALYKSTKRHVLPIASDPADNLRAFLSVKFIVADALQLSSSLCWGCMQKQVEGGKCACGRSYPQCPTLQVGDF